MSTFDKLFGGLTQGLTQTLFAQQEEQKTQGLEDLLSHLQHNNPAEDQDPSHLMVKQPAEAQPEQSPTQLKLKDENIDENKSDQGWGNDDDLLLDGLDQDINDKKNDVDSVNKVEKEQVFSKSEIDTTPKAANVYGLYNKVTFANEEEPARDSKRKLSSQIKGIRDKATGITKNFTDNFLGVMNNYIAVDAPVDMKSEDVGKKEKTVEEGEYKNVFTNMFQYAQRKVDDESTRRTQEEALEEMKKEAKYFKEQAQKYMAQANQLEMLVKIEQDTFHRESEGKKKEIVEMDEDIRSRLDVCQKKEKDLRILDDKIKIKEQLNLDEAYLEELAKQRESIQDKIAGLQQENKNLEITLNNERERLQKEQENSLKALKNDMKVQFKVHEEKLKKEHEEAMKRRKHHYKKAIAIQYKKHDAVVQKVKAWSVLFQDFKKASGEAFNEIRKTLVTREEQLLSSTEIIKDFQEKLTNVRENYQSQVDKKDKKLSQYKELEAKLREQIVKSQREYAQNLSVKEREIEDLQDQQQNLVEAYEVEKESYVALQSKFEKITLAVQENEKKANILIQQNKDLTKNIEKEKLINSSLNQKIEKLSCQKKSREETLEALERTNSEMKEKLGVEQEKVEELKMRLDELSLQEEESFQRLATLEKKREEAEDALENVQSEVLALKLKLDEASLTLKEKEEAIESIQVELKESEEKHMNEIRELKKENYQAEESYLFEINKLTQELKEIEKVNAERCKTEEVYLAQIRQLTQDVEDLKVSNEDLKANVKTSTKNEESEKKIQELEDEVDVLMREKDEMMAKYDEQNAQLVSTYEERFKNLNLYIEEMYSKNHQLIEENSKTNAKFEKLKEKLSAFNISIKSQTDIKEPANYSPNIIIEKVASVSENRDVQEEEAKEELVVVEQPKEDIVSQAEDEQEKSHYSEGKDEEETTSVNHEEKEVLFVANEEAKDDRIPTPCFTNKDLSVDNIVEEILRPEVVNESFQAQSQDEIAKVVEIELENVNKSICQKEKNERNSDGDGEQDLVSTDVCRSQQTKTEEEERSEETVEKQIESGNVQTLQSLGEEKIEEPKSEEAANSDDVRVVESNTSFCNEKQEAFKEESGAKADEAEENWNVDIIETSPVKEVKPEAIVEEEEEEEDKQITIEEQQGEWGCNDLNLSLDKANEQSSKEEISAPTFQEGTSINGQESRLTLKDIEAFVEDEILKAIVEELTKVAIEMKEEHRLVANVEEAKIEKSEEEQIEQIQQYKEETHESSNENKVHEEVAFIIEDILAKVFEKKEEIMNDQLGEDILIKESDAKLELKDGFAVESIKDNVGIAVIVEDVLNKVFEKKEEIVNDQVEKEALVEETGLELELEDGWGLENVKDTEEKEVEVLEVSTEGEKKVEGIQTVEVQSGEKNLVEEVDQQLNIQEVVQIPESKVEGETSVEIQQENNKEQEPEVVVNAGWDADLDLIETEDLPDVGTISKDIVVNHEIVENQAVLGESQDEIVAEAGWNVDVDVDLEVEEASVQVKPETETKDQIKIELTEAEEFNLDEGKSSFEKTPTKNNKPRFGGDFFNQSAQKTEVAKDNKKLVSSSVTGPLRKSIVPTFNLKKSDTITLSDVKAEKPERKSSLIINKGLLLSKKPKDNKTGLVKEEEEKDEFNLEEFLGTSCK